MSKQDAAIIKRGLKRIMLALATTIAFVAALWGFYLVAVTDGYVAVATFIVSMLTLFFAFVLLYAQGMTRKSRAKGQGDGK